MTRHEIRALMDPRRDALAAPTSSPQSAPEPVEEPAASALVAPDEAPDRPEHEVPRIPRVDTVYAPLRAPVPDGAELLYKPAWIATADVTLVHTPSRSSEQRRIARVLALNPAPSTWDRAFVVGDHGAWTSEPPHPGRHLELPEHALTGATAARHQLTDHLYNTERSALFYHSASKRYAEPGEAADHFRHRIRHAILSSRDEAREALERRYRTRFDRLEAELKRADAAIEREADQARRAQREVTGSIGTSVLNAFFGRRRSAVRGGGSAIRKAQRAREQAEDVREARDKRDAVQRELDALETEFRAELQAFDAAHAPHNAPVETVAMKPRRKDIKAVQLRLLWLPVVVLEGAPRLWSDLRPHA